MSRFEWLHQMAQCLLVHCISMPGRAQIQNQSNTDTAGTDPEGPGMANRINNLTLKCQLILMQNEKKTGCNIQDLNTIVYCVLQREVDSKKLIVLLHLNKYFYSQFGQQLQLHREGWSQSSEQCGNAVLGLCLLLVKILSDL